MFGKYRYEIKIFMYLFSTPHPHPKKYDTKRMCGGLQRDGERIRQRAGTVGESGEVRLEPAGARWHCCGREVLMVALPRILTHFRF